VGHLERFNPAVIALEARVTLPLFFEIHRLSVFSPRSLDVDVILDLMIHDIDIILSIVGAAGADPEEVRGAGISILSPKVDIANARLQFPNGCVANLTASRISPQRMRKIRVFSGGENPSHVSLDYRAQEGFIYRVAREGEEESSLFKKLLRGKDSAIVSEFAGRKIVREPVPIEKDEPLKLELRHFIDCVQTQQTPKVSGAEAQRSLDLAFEITRLIQAGQPHV
jgi:predicted dehydrogenase